jgi:predicted dehydrogenase
MTTPHILMRLTGGASGQLWASMVANGNGHGQQIRVYGDKGSLAWVQENPNRLIYRREGEPDQVYSKANAYLAETGLAASRVAPGHPGGFIEAFANLYREIADAIEAARGGGPGEPARWLFPTIDDGVAGLAFVEAAMRSHDNDGNWVSLEPAGDA